VLDELGDIMVELTTSEESRLSKLEPETQMLVRQLIQNMKDQGIDVFVGQTLRTSAEEKSVIAAGKSAVKSHSWHELGRAADIYPIDPNTGEPDLNGVNNALFGKLAENAQALGLHSLAYNADGSRHYLINTKGKPFWDGGHVENHGPYATIADAVAAEGPNFGIG
jgi:hypothetical protein